jgi:hypothetical protein
MDINRLRSTLASAQGDRLSELAYHIVQLSFISYNMLYVKKNMESFQRQLVIAYLKKMRSAQNKSFCACEPTRGLRYRVILNRCMNIRQGLIAEEGPALK